MEGAHVQLKTRLRFMNTHILGFGLVLLQKHEALALATLASLAVMAVSSLTRANLASLAHYYS